MTSASTMRTSVEWLYSFQREIMRADPNHADEDQNQSHPNDREHILPAHRLFFLLFTSLPSLHLVSFLPFSPELYPSLYLF